MHNYIKYWIVTIAFLAFAGPSIAQNDGLRLSEHPLFSGAVAVCCGDAGETGFASTGIANRDTDAPFTTATRYNTGSMGKFLTMIAVRQLEARSRLSLSDPVIEHLPQFDGLISPDITIEHLLSHTSGLPEILSLGPSLLSAEDNADYVRVALDAGFSTGGPAEHEYVNTNFMLLGAIIAAVSGQTYEDYMRTHVLAPAGVTGDPFIRSEDLSVPDAAAGYLPLSWDDYWAAEGPVLPDSADEFTHPARPVQPHRVANAAGGHYYSIEELDRLLRALATEIWLPLETVRESCTARFPYRADNPATGYGWGCEAYTLDGGLQIIGHTGGAPGVETYLFLAPETGHYAAVMSNFDGQAGPVWRQVRGRLASQP